MPRPFVLPDLGEGLVEAEIVKVLVSAGDIVREDAPLLEVETDKATVEIPSPMSGRVERVHVTPNQTVRVGEVLVTFADAAPAGKDAADTLDPTRTLAPPPPPSPAPAMTPASSAAVTSVPGAERRGPVPAAPSTRRLARELGVDLRVVAATGAGGRVTDDDVRAAAQRPAVDAAPLPTTPTRSTTAGASRSAPPREGAVAAPRAPRPLAAVGLEPPALPNFAQWGPIERAPLSHLRRTIAERMALSAALIPHVTHFDRADITDLDGVIRRNLEAGRARGVTLTLTSFLLKAAALALADHPQFNASLDAAAGELILKRYVHLGVAVAIERGLIVPVMRDVDKKSVLEIAAELGALAARAREGKAALDELRGGTFTITNIGALGGTGAIPIINYPEVAILGVARGRDEAVVREGQIVPRLMLPLSLTFDHRVADGADGARFTTDIVRRLERPDQLLLGL
jgi:pyruvate dehydrogenase E2 component (dihydrolipoamide acetyltransferase)